MLLPGWEPYSCQVFHFSLPKHLSNAIERVQKRVISIVFPGTHYKEGLTTAGLYSLSERRGEACLTLFHEIASNPQHKLSSLLYPRLLKSHIIWGKLELLNNLKSNQIDLNIHLFQLAFVQWNFNLNSWSVMWSTLNIILLKC